MEVARRLRQFLWRCGRRFLQNPSDAPYQVAASWHVAAPASPSSGDHRPHDRRVYRGSRRGSALSRHTAIRTPGCGGLPHRRRIHLVARVDPLGTHRLERDLCRGAPHGHAPRTAHGRRVGRLRPFDLASSGWRSWPTRCRDRFRSRGLACSDRVFVLRWRDGFRIRHRGEQTSVARAADEMGAARSVYAIANVCTHAGGPLNEGTWVGKDRCEIQCPWHASRFCVKDGAVHGGPATFSEVTFEVRTDGSGRIEVRAR
ncbi:MAG: Rieske (2Fe-2S) protein [Chloroflexi bacterium]|nr:MAG: Rieske (2Fe-2S) protein [Chloroflexota bacterium]